MGNNIGVVWVLRVCSVGVVWVRVCSVGVVWVRVCIVVYGRQLSADLISAVKVLKLVVQARGVMPLMSHRKYSRTKHRRYSRTNHRRYSRTNHRRYSRTNHRRYSRSQLRGDVKASFPQYNIFCPHLIGCDHFYDK